MITNTQAVALAVRYNAYIEARNARDLESVIYWGKKLDGIQTITGVVLIDYITLECDIERASKNLGFT